MKKRNRPAGETPDVWDQVNRYGTYNIQPTADTPNLFPMIAHGLPEQEHGRQDGERQIQRKNRRNDDSRS